MKKTLAMLLALVMLFALAACNDQADPPDTSEPSASDNENPNGPAVYTYEEDRGDFKITWTLTMYPNGVFYLNEENGMNGNSTEHSGSTWRENDNGTISTGPWSNADVDKSDFFQSNGECTWIVNDDGTMEPTDHVAAGPSAGSYTYDEDRGDFQVNWTITLNEDGTFVLEEVHGLSGNLTTHTGQTWTDNGDGTFTTGAWDADENKSEFFKPNGECTWKLNEDGTCEPVVEEGSGSGSESTGISAGKYSYVEDRGDFQVTWDILLMGNGNCRIDETNGLNGSVTEHTASGWTDNGDGTVTTGEWEDKEVNKSDFFQPTGECTWKITGDGTCEPAGNDGGSGGESTGISAGKYAYVEDKGAIQFTWEILLMGNGNCRIDETGPSGETVGHTADGWVDNGDGTATTGAWEDADAEKSDFFAADGSCTWTINSDGTATPVA